MGNAMQLEYFPAVKQMGDELRELREQTVPELNREVSDLKNMTREILELLRPPGLPAHSGSALLKEDKGYSPAGKAAPRELPELPSAIGDEHKEDAVMWVAPRASPDKGLAVNFPTFTPHVRQSWQQRILALFRF